LLLFRETLTLGPCCLLLDEPEAFGLDIGKALNRNEALLFKNG
jgi:hypothetical protein